MTEEADKVLESQNDDGTYIEPDQEITKQVDTAPTPEEGEHVATDSEKVQARFDKLTAEKYQYRNQAREERLRSDRLEQRLNLLKNKAPVKIKPREEDFDYDSALFNQAKVDYEVEQRLIVERETLKVQARDDQAKVEQGNLQQSFNQKADQYRKDHPGFDEASSKIPTLPQGTLDFLISQANSPALIEYLGNNLELAYELASAQPMQAASIIGSLRNSASTKTVKVSAAPDPFKPVNSGSRGQVDEFDKFSEGCTFE